MPNKPAAVGRQLSAFSYQSPAVCGRWPIACRQLAVLNGRVLRPISSSRACLLPPASCLLPLAYCFI
jgi:hypothetical protein